MGIVSLRHVGIVVRDMDSMLRFYCDLLGFSVAARRSEPVEVMDELLCLLGVKLVTVKLSAPGGSMLELLQFASHPPIELEPRSLSDIGLSHIAVTVSNLQGEYERLRKAGVEFLSAPRVSGTAKLAFAIDPEGGFVEMVEVLH